MSEKKQLILSDPVTKEQFDRNKMTLKIDKIIDYGKVSGYITEETSTIVYMLIVKNDNSNFNPRLYYLDVKGNLKDNPNLITLLDEKGKDLADHIEATLEVDEGEFKTLVWHKKSLSKVLNKNHRIAEYTATNNDGFANLCLIDWEGDNKTGNIKVWYGQKIKSKEFKIIL